jgi:hypothetical protein
VTDVKPGLVTLIRLGIKARAVGAPLNIVAPTKVVIAIVGQRRRVLWTGPSAAASHAFRFFTIPTPEDWRSRVRIPVSNRWPRGEVVDNTPVLKTKARRRTVC